MFMQGESKGRINMDQESDKRKVIKGLSKRNFEERIVCVVSTD